MVNQPWWSFFFSLGSVSWDEQQAHQHSLSLSPLLISLPNFRSADYFFLWAFHNQLCSSDMALNIQWQMYHSSFVNEDGVKKACGCPLLPLKTHIKGPAPGADQGKEGIDTVRRGSWGRLFLSARWLSDAVDIVDEAITFFRANVFFKNFDVQSSADKLLVYLTLYINVALKRLEGCRTLAEGTKAIINLGLETVPVPGEQGFPFSGLFTPPQSKKEAGTLSLSLSLNGIWCLWVGSDGGSSSCCRVIEELSEADQGGDQRKVAELRLPTQRHAQQMVAGLRQEDLHGHGHPPTPSLKPQTRAFISLSLSL